MPLCLAKKRENTSHAVSGKAFFEHEDTKSLRKTLEFSHCVLKFFVMKSDKFDLVSLRLSV